MATLTAANAIVMLSIDGVYNTPQQIQQFAADNVFNFEEITQAEVSMGVDGVLSGGFVFEPIPWVIHLQSNSPSIPVFDNWIQAQRTNKDISTASATVQLVGLGYKWTMTNGILTKGALAPSAAKIVGPRTFTITWESVSPAAIG